MLDFSHGVALVWSEAKLYRNSTKGKNIYQYKVLSKANLLFSSDLVLYLGLVGVREVMRCGTLVAAPSSSSWWQEGVAGGGKLWCRWWQGEGIGRSGKNRC